MALNNSEVVIIAAGTSVAPGGTEASPQTGGTGQNVTGRADYANSFDYRIKNGASAPGVALTIVFYAFNNSGRLYEVARVSGDTVANSEYSGVIQCPAGHSGFTAKAFGNTTNAVTAEVYLACQAP